MLSGCSVFSDSYQPPQAEVQGAWVGKSAGAEWPQRAWWSGFGSRELDGLMADGQQANHDVRAAAARVEQARASARIGSAGLFPQLTAQAGAQRAKSAGGISKSTYSLGGDASYEVDLWGLNRANARAGDAALLASQYAQETVRLTFTADLANAYFELLSLNDRLHTAEGNLAIAERLLALLEAQKAAGRVSALELERQRSQVASTRAALAPLRQQRQVARDALAVLLARLPNAAPDSQASLRALALPTVGSGVSSELLERRPDVRQAEANLEAANANVKAARAAVLPSFTLSAGGGWSAGSTGALFQSGSGFYALAANLVGTLFDGGRKLGQVDLAKAQRTELVEAYLLAVKSAYRDVEDALAGIEQLGAAEELQIEAARTAREAYRLAELRFKAGAVDFTTVLDAQRTLLAAESAVDGARIARVNAIVSLYRALGGGWDGALAAPLAAR